MKRTARLLVAALTIAAACNGDGPASPSPLLSGPGAPPTSPPQSQGRIAAPFPAPSAPAAVYVDPGDLYWWAAAFHEGKLLTRFVLYDDGTMALQVSSPRFGFADYRGTYVRADTLITFRFAFPGTATATLYGDNLTVKYDLFMVVSDFQDGTYVRSR